MNDLTRQEPPKDNRLTVVRNLSLPHLQRVEEPRIRARDLDGGTVTRTAASLGYACRRLEFAMSSDGLVRALALWTFKLLCIGLLLLVPAWLLLMVGVVVLEHLVRFVWLSVAVAGGLVVLLMLLRILLGGWFPRW